MKVTSLNMDMTTPQRNLLRGELGLEEETLNKIDKANASWVIDKLVKLKRTYEDYPIETRVDERLRAVQKFARQVVKDYNPSSLICGVCKGSKVVGEGKPCHC